MYSTQDMSSLNSFDVQRNNLKPVLQCCFKIEFPRLWSSSILNLPKYYYIIYSCILLILSLNLSNTYVYGILIR